MRQRAIEFTAEMVEDWCERVNDPNPIHTDEEVAADSTFGQRVVPGMMLMDHVSGMLTALGDEDEEVILSGITAFRFRDPVLLDETVTISAEIVEDDSLFTAVDIEARVKERGSLVATGTISIVIE